jgi:hypothetical protein
VGRPGFRAVCETYWNRVRKGGVGGADLQHGPSWRHRGPVAGGARAADFSPGEPGGGVDGVGRRGGLENVCARGGAASVRPFDFESSGPGLRRFPPRTDGRNVILILDHVATLLAEPVWSQRGFGRFPTFWSRPETSENAPVLILDHVATLLAEPVWSQRGLG